MKRVAVAVALVWLAAGCQFGGDEAMINQVENAVREELSSRGTVKQVELTRENESRLTGFAMVELRDRPGSEVRFNCTADRQGDSGASYNWRCAEGQQQASAGTNGADSADTGGKDPQEAAPAPGPGPAGGPGRAALVGRWTDTGDCSVVTLLGEDGIFIAPNGGRGNWSLNGNVFTLSGPGGSASWTIQLADPNTLVLTDQQGGTSTSTRC